MPGWVDAGQGIGCCHAPYAKLVQRIAVSHSLGKGCGHLVNLLSKLSFGIEKWGDTQCRYGPTIRISEGGNRARTRTRRIQNSVRDGYLLSGGLVENLVVLGQIVGMEYRFFSDRNHGGSTYRNRTGQSKATRASVSHAKNSRPHGRLESPMVLVAHPCSRGPSCCCMWDSGGRTTRPAAGHFCPPGRAADPVPLVSTLNDFDGSSSRLADAMRSQGVGVSFGVMR